MKKFIYLLLIVFAGCQIQQDEIKNVISLEGEWDFKMDPFDQGISEDWQNASFNESVQLPGSMRENGKGEEVTVSTEWIGDIVDQSWYTEEKYARYREPGNVKIPFWLKPVKYYKGPAWYKKEVNMPITWEGKRIILYLERCHWESTVFINGQKAGSRNSLATPHEYDITQHIQPGKNQVCIRIDNRMVIPLGVNSHSVSDHTQSNWNGIVGKIFLKAVHPVFIDDIQVFPDIQEKNTKVVITLLNNTTDSFEGKLQIQAESFNTEAIHLVDKKTHQFHISGQREKIEIIYPMGENVRFWSEFDPALYKLNVNLADNEEEILDQQVIDFGMREFKAEGTRFEVNGHPVFLRGTLECCIFPLTGYPPTDTESWEYVIKRCQEHGLNHMRFHSWCPPEAAFAAADKLGFYFQVECSSWANQGATVGDGSPVDSFIYEEGDRILKMYGNHPSFCMMAYGNEPGGRNQNAYLGDLLTYWKAKDNRRVYTSGAGWPSIPENEYHNLPQARIQHWGEGLGSIINSEPPQTMFDYHDIISEFDVPYVSHEIGQWCVYPNFEEISKYTGVLKPTNFEIFQETLTENHIGDLADDFLLASGKLQALCYKAEIEAALRTPEFAGFQLLQLHDFPGQGTALVGVLDPFFGSKGYVTPEEFRRFCDETVLLARMKKRVFEDDENFLADIEISHFGEKPLENQKIIYRIIDSGKETVKTGEFTVDKIGIDNAVQIGTISFPLSQITPPQKLTLEVNMEETAYSNSWDFWVYPKELDTDPGEFVHVTYTLDDKTINILDQGGSVLLLSYGSITEGKGAEIEIGFSSIFWNTAWTNGQAPHTLGILCDPEHPVFESFPTEYHSNWQWWDLVTFSQVMILDEFPAELKPLVQPIDDWFENRRLALAFEARTGNGKILFCSIDMKNNMENRPATKQLYHSMIEYMKSDAFDPKIDIDLSNIKNLTAE